MAAAHPDAGGSNEQFIAARKADVAAKKPRKPIVEVPMSARQRLPNRRASHQFSFECNSLRYVATVSFFADGDLAEYFWVMRKPAVTATAPPNSAVLFTRSAIRRAG